MSTTAIEKELQMGLVHRAKIHDVVVKRMLSVIMNPNRYRSKAAEAFCKNILPQFAPDFGTHLTVPKVSLETYTVEPSEPLKRMTAPYDRGNHLVMPDFDA